MMKKCPSFLLSGFFQDSKKEFLMVGLFLILSAPFGYSFSSSSSGQLPGQERPSFYTIPEEKTNTQNIKKPDFRRSSALLLADGDYSYNLSSVPEASFVEFMFSGFYKYLIPDTISSAGEDKYIKSLREDKFKGGRTARWYFAWVIFKDYSWYKKIFGGGFDYLEMFGEKFGEAKYDWPHNPIISAFLYSGIFGGIVFICFLIMVIANYLFYLKRHLFFFISFAITFFFVFFSDTSLFNTPLFTILCLIPFFTKYLHLKEKYNESQKIPIKKILFW